MYDGQDRFSGYGAVRLSGIKANGKPYRVLIVDDSVFIAKQLGQMLSSEGFQVTDHALDGLQAVEKYRERQSEIDLVTMDITMPVVNGITALREILEINKDAKVIMVSALGKEDIVKECLMSGAKSYIVKPLERKKVLDRIKSVLTH